MPLINYSEQAWRCLCRFSQMPGRNRFPTSLSHYARSYRVTQGTESASLQCMEETLGTSRRNQRRGETPRECALRELRKKQSESYGCEFRGVMEFRLQPDHRTEFGALYRATLWNPDHFRQTPPKPVNATYLLGSPWRLRAWYASSCLDCPFFRRSVSRASSHLSARIHRV